MSQDLFEELHELLIPKITKSTTNWRTPISTRERLVICLRFMAAGKHIGKVLLKVRDEEPSGVAPTVKLVTAEPRLYLDPEKSYVVVGGLGGFGIELVQWLISRGATKLVITSRSGVRSGYQAWQLRRWRAAGAIVVLSTVDVGAGGARDLLRTAVTLGPVGGVFNLAAILRDAFLENLSEDDFRTVARPKVDGTLALDEATRELAPGLDHFVVFSSTVSGRGNTGQTNYGYANSVMERICERRQADGLPALAIQWGAIGDVGLVAETMRADSIVGGTYPQRIASCLDTLGMIMTLSHAVVAAFVLPDKHRVDSGPRQNLALDVANILGIKDITAVADTAGLGELGMDSLMSAEIKQTLEREYGITVTVQEIRNFTFGKLKELASDSGMPTILKVN